MLQSLELKRVRHDLATEQQQLGHLVNLKQMPEDLYAVVFCGCCKVSPQTQ